MPFASRRETLGSNEDKVGLLLSNVKAIPSSHDGAPRRRRADALTSDDEARTLLLSDV